MILTEDIPGVPEGTPGKCGRGLGFAIKRYRVRFDNDVEAMSVAHSKLVPENEWPQFLARRAREAIEAAQETARAAEARAAAAEARGLPAASGDTETATAEPSPAPAEATPATAAPEDSGGGDPRLAALMARAAAARKETGVPAPASDAAAITDPEPAPATAAELAAAPAAAAAPARTGVPSGPPRVDIPEFVPGPEVDPDYAPASNRVSELLDRVREAD